MPRVPPYPQVNFNFNMSDPISILIGAGVLCLITGVISALFILVLGIVFIILGAMFLIIGILIMAGSGQQGGNVL